MTRTNYFNHCFQTFGEESSSVLLAFYLFLGFFGFFLLLLLISMVFITIARDDQIVLVDTEEDEKYESCDTRADFYYFIPKKKMIVQRENHPSCLLMTIRQEKTFYVNLLLKIVHLPVSVYSFYTLWKQGIENDFILVN